MDPEAFLKTIFTRSLERMEPGARTLSWLERHGKEKNALPEGRPVWMLAAGKAALPMSAAAAEWLGGRLQGGLVACPRGKEGRSGPKVNQDLDYVEAAHPLPDEGSLEAGGRAVELVKGIPREGVLLALISGGASSLLCLPEGEVSLDDLRGAYKKLLASGEDIAAVNAARKRMSAIKGGRLLRHLRPEAGLLNLVVSDVPGDDPALVGSGPTVPPEITEQRRPHRTEVIASAAQLAREAARVASGQGVTARVESPAYSGRVEELAPRMASRLEACRNGGETGLLIWYGESTVKVTGEGRGGRNQELALRAALEVEGWEGVCWLSADTDGIDGPTDAAGAVASAQTAARARRGGLDPLDFLARNDAYRFHERMGTLLRTGPTGNNLMDLQLVWTGCQEPPDVRF
ncbi:MAG: DUF4147 domain-containing protein [Balneolaceae bacterium]|nr:DUF4147 domain-containing protein [Balneolaceae bacterium]